MASSVPVCGVCQSRHKSTPADEWCSECDEGLCGVCIEHHSAAKISRCHTTTPITEYLVLPEFVKSIKQICEQHHEKLSLYCNDHSSPCCRSCVSDIHRSCTRIDKIEQVTGNVKASASFTEIEDYLSDITETVILLMREREENLKSIRKERKTIEEDINEMRRRINEHLDKIQAQTLKSLIAVEEKEYSKIQSVIKLLSDSQNDISKYQKNISDIKMYASDIQAFFAIGHLEKTVQNTNRYIKQILTNEGVDKFSFNIKANEVLQNLFHAVTFVDIKIERRSCTFNIDRRKAKGAQLKITRPVTRSIDGITLTLNKTFDINASGSFGCVFLPDGRTVFPCSNKKTVSVYDANGKYQFETIVSNALDVTFSEDTDTIHISTGDRRKQEFIHLNMNNKKTTTICNTYNYGVIARGNSLIYCAESKGVCQKNMTEGSVKIIVKENLPWYCYVTEFKKKLYYTNHIDNTVTCCGINRQKVWQFKNDSLKGPMGIDVDNFGIVYCVGYRTHNVIVISPDGQWYKEILSKNDGLNFPTALHCPRTTNKLLVTNEKSKAFLFDIGCN